MLKTIYICKNFGVFHSYLLGGVNHLRDQCKDIRFSKDDMHLKPFSMFGLCVRESWKQRERGPNSHMMANVLMVLKMTSFKCTFFATLWRVCVLNCRMLGG